MNDLSFSTKEVFFSCRDEAIEWIINNQFGRRNLSKYDRSVLALKLKPVIEEKARCNLVTHTEQGYQKSDKAVDTKKEIAKLAGVSHDTIHKVEKIEKDASEDIKQQVKSGELSIHQAYTLTKSAEDAKKFNDEAMRRYDESEVQRKLKLEEQREQKEIEDSLPQNTVILDKFRKPEEIHIFGITDFKNLTYEQQEKCLTHSGRYLGSMLGISSLRTDKDDLIALRLGLSPDDNSYLLSVIETSIQKLVKIQNYLKGGKL